VARYSSIDGESLLDLTNVWHMTLSPPGNGIRDSDNPLTALPTTEAPDSGLFSNWYEAAVSSAKAADIFKENEGMTAGDEASWDTSTLSSARVFAATYKPALEMVRKMDGVGVKVDNRQGRRYPTPAWNARIIEMQRLEEQRSGDDPAGAFW